MANKLRVFRTARRWRQRDLADQVEVWSRRVLDETLSVTERTVSRWEGGDTPSLPAQRVLAALFDVSPDELGFPAAAPEGLAVSGAQPSDAERSDSWDAFELVARLTRSDASDATLAMLARRVDRLCRHYAVGPAEDLLTESRRWLERTLAMTERRLTLAQHRETLVQAGWLSALVACLAYDIGDQPSAEGWREATAQLGNETGHAELTGWSHEIAAWMALTSGRPRDAADYMIDSVVVVRGGAGSRTSVGAGLREPALMYANTRRAGCPRPALDREPAAVPAAYVDTSGSAASHQP